MQTSKRGKPPLFLYIISLLSTINKRRKPFQKDNKLTREKEGREGLSAPFFYLSFTTTFTFKQTKICCFSVFHNHYSFFRRNILREVLQSVYPIKEQNSVSCGNIWVMKCFRSQHQKDSIYKTNKLVKLYMEPNFKKCLWVTIFNSFFEFSTLPNISMNYIFTYLSTIETIIDKICDIKCFSLFYEIFTIDPLFVNLNFASNKNLIH